MKCDSCGRPDHLIIQELKFSCELWSIDESINLPVNQSIMIDQSINLTKNQSITKLLNRWMNEVPVRVEQLVSGSIQLLGRLLSYQTKQIHYLKKISLIKQSKLLVAINYYYYYIIINWQSINTSAKHKTYHLIK